MYGTRQPRLDALNVRSLAAFVACKNKLCNTSVYRAELSWLQKLDDASLSRATTRLTMNFNGSSAKQTIGWLIRSKIKDPPHTDLKVHCISLHLGSPLI